MASSSEQRRVATASYPICIPYEGVSGTDYGRLLAQLKRPVPFPYKRYFMTPPQQLFQNLQTKEFVRVKLEFVDNKWKCPGGKHANKTIVFEVAEDAYDQCDVIGDYYNEEARVRSHAGGKRSAMEIWEDRLRKPQTIANQALTLIDSNPAMQARARVRGIDALLLREVIYGMARECTQFKPTLTRALLLYLARILQLKPEELTVLDPCSGWGDRLIGALATGVKKYIGVDPNPLVHEGYAAICRDFDPPLARPGGTEAGAPAARSPRVELHRQPFEDFVSGPAGGVDIVFTSPPFGDYELYHTGVLQDSRQSNVAYKPEEWAEKWLLPVVDKMWALLRPGGILALHLADAPRVKVTARLQEHMRKHAPAASGVLACRRGAKRPLPIWVWHKAGRETPLADLGRAQGGVP